MADKKIILPTSDEAAKISTVTGWVSRSPAQRMKTTIAALFVRTRGVYWDLPGVDCWDEPRDARSYRGPHKIIAHPPCARWGRYWSGGPTKAKKKGDDAGCFEAALLAVRRWGGVLEHPSASYAWEHYKINKPPRNGGWIEADTHGGWTCCLEQGHYGHKARKATWLYAKGIYLPGLTWGPSEKRVNLDGLYSVEERCRAIKTGICQRLSKHQREDTPIEFRNLLITMVREGVDD